MNPAKTMTEYHKDLKKALSDKFLRQTLDTFAISYKESRISIFSGMDEKKLISDISHAKAENLPKMEALFIRFAEEAKKRGVHVHRAGTAEEANEIICRIARENDCKKTIKSKSMTAEEIHVNAALEEQGCEVTETDLGEWIIQLRHEHPSHMVLPAIHLSRFQVADTFSRETGKEQESEIEKLVKVARRELREKFIEADMGISGANFAVADTGTVAICTNEGNGRLTTTLPRVHVALCGLDKLMPSIHDALRVIRVLARNATAQAITTYVSWITGAAETAATENHRKIMHVIFLDNGRSALAKDETCKSALHCVRCGACANVCPVYRMVGGHKMGHIYIGAIGLILTYFFHGKDKARNLVQNCIYCQACKDVCAAGIDLPAIITEIRARLVEEEGGHIDSTLLALVMRDRTLFHTFLRFAKFAQRPVTGGTPWLRHLPDIFLKDQKFRALPALAAHPFRDQWNEMEKDLPKTGNFRIGLFSGCAQDFIYPEQLFAAVEILKQRGCIVDFPMDQTCCGLPVKMMGERNTFTKMAAQNVGAFDPARFDYILTLCASCASHLKHGYPKLLGNHPSLGTAVERFSERVMDFSSFVRNVLGLSEGDFLKSDEKVGYHSPCHMTRGMNVVEEPRSLIQFCADYVESREEDVCCGFGGTYSVKFPEVSSQILAKKLDYYEDSGASNVVTDCPGCVLQLRGGEERRNRKFRVEHIAELLLRQMKK